MRQGRDHVKMMLSGDQASPPEVVKPTETIRLATTIGAKVIRKEAELGCQRENGLADLPLLGNNPESSH
jgi:imidazolonepropionase-like amidohydrolase